MNHMKTTATTEAVSLPPEEKWHWIQQWRRNTTCAGQKPRSDWKNDLQIQGAGRKSRKSPTPFVGIKPYGISQSKRLTESCRSFPGPVWSSRGCAVSYDPRRFNGQYYDNN